MALFELILELSGEVLISGVGQRIRRSYSRTWLSRNMFRGSDKVADYHELFVEHYKFYRALPGKSQRLFRRRVTRFLGNKRIIGKQNVTVSDEMRMLIAASAVKLTFGLDDFEFEGFKNIFIYPERYYSKMTGSVNKGETHSLGAIVFSWEDFMEGVMVHDDNLHLGVHEFTHALVLDMKRGNMYDPYFLDVMRELHGLMEKPKIREAVLNKGYLRDYAEENFMEFLAVSLESFFETPTEFKENLPPIYERICKLLNQDTHQLYLRAKL